MPCCTHKHMGTAYHKENDRTGPAANTSRLNAMDGVRC
jgi:hypothetical protein